MIEWILILTIFSPAHKIASVQVLGALESKAVCESAGSEWKKGVIKDLAVRETPQLSYVCIKNKIGDK